MCVPPVGVLSSCNCLSNPLFLYCIVASIFLFFVFVLATINEFYVGFDGGNKTKKRKKKGDGKMISLMILGLSIRTFISSLK
jgi:hypothetical protein